MRVVFFISAVMLAAGCGASLIPGTQVDDTAANRSVYDVIEGYREGMETQNRDRIAGLISRQYYENSSTTDTTADDYGYEELVQQVLPKLLDNIKHVQYRIQVRRIEVDGNRAIAEYEYFYKFQYAEGGRERWISRNDFNRLDLVFEEGSWKIVAGL